MKNLFQPDAVDEVISRIDKLQPTAQISARRDFNREQEQLKARIRQFHQGGEAQCTKHPHPFFGALTLQEWSTGMYKPTITCVNLECKRLPRAAL